MIIHRREHRVLVQGLTGKQGTFWTEKMIACGTRVVGGVNPKRAGESHIGLPVFASAKAAMESAPFDTAVMFIPPAMAKDAALDAIGAGAKSAGDLDRAYPGPRRHDDPCRGEDAATRASSGPIPRARSRREKGSWASCPGTTRMCSSPAALVSSHAAAASARSSVSISRRAGLGQSAFVGIGGDPMIGTTTRDALQALNEDERTDGIVLVGEIGGSMEEQAAEYAKTMSKPIVSFIAGRASPPGKKMGHAGAIVTGNAGTYAGKRKALEAAGVIVVDTPREIPSRTCASGSPEPAESAGARPLETQADLALSIHNPSFARMPTK